jgi:hypothetical protein
MQIFILFQVKDSSMEINPEKIAIDKSNLIDISKNISKDPRNHN